jgi:hypothetical protein
MRRAFMAIAVNIVFIAFYCVPGLAATVVVNDDNYVTEIRSLVVPSFGLYNVEFYYGTYAEIWGTGFDFPGNYAAVEAVCEALNAHETSPTLILYEDLEGDPYSPFGAFYIPYEYNQINPAEVVTLRMGQYVASESRWRNFGDISRGIDQPTPYAKFSQVPIPGAIWLLGTGLIGIVGIRRKFKKLKFE